MLSALLLVGYVDLLKQYISDMVNDKQAKPVKFLFGKPA